ncbi:MAG: peptidoglycan DD-metalloendopeptidase family protein [Bacteroidales bacterium]|nr:peptidoglycan DD-metalloendopeptidase family protein [Bacteroidales bacterium]
MMKRLAVLMCVAVVRVTSVCAPLFAGSPEPMTLSRAERLVPRPAMAPVESACPKSDCATLDTIPTANPNAMIVLYADNTWKYVKNAENVLKEDVFRTNWNNTGVDPYHLEYSNLPIKEILWLVDSAGCYHFPGDSVCRITSRYGRRHGRYHRGVDIAQPKGTPVYATFDGKVRMSKYYKGYGNLIVIRHENGLETLYGHLAERKFNEGDWVQGGQVIGLTGNTGRSTGPHIHYEVRYKGYAIDPEWMIDFNSKTLHHHILVLKKKMLFPDSKFTPETDDEEDEIAAADEADRLEAERLEAELKAARYHTIKKGDTLGRIAANNGTTVSAICKLNGITPKTTLRIGRKIRVK